MTASGPTALPIRRVERRSCRISGPRRFGLGTP